MNNSNYDLFFSYSRSTLRIATRIIHILEEYGLVIWFDRTDVPLGCHIKNNLNNIMNQAESWVGMISLIDNEYLFKEWCKMELDYAMENKIHIFPILYEIEKTDLISDYSYLKNLNIVTIRHDNDIDYAINKLLDSIIFHFNVLPQKKPIYGKVFYLLSQSYANTPRLKNEKVICANNVALFIETKLKSLISHYERILINIIHLKTTKLYSNDGLEQYDFKVVCHAANILLEIFTPTEQSFLLSL